MSQNSEMMMQSKLAILNKKLERAGLGIVLTGAVDQTDDIFTVNSVEREDGEIVVKSQAQGTAAMCEQQIDAYVIDKLVATIEKSNGSPATNSAVKNIIARAAVAGAQAEAERLAEEHNTFIRSAIELKQAGALTDEQPIFERVTKRDAMYKETQAVIRAMRIHLGA